MKRIKENLNFIKNDNLYKTVICISQELLGSMKKHRSDRVRIITF